LLGGKKVHPRRQNPGYAYVVASAYMNSRRIYCMFCDLVDVMLIYCSPN